MSGGVPIRCFTCGKVTGNLYSHYLRLVKEGNTSHSALDILGLGRECCRRMLATHVDMMAYQLQYPTYEDGIQRVGGAAMDRPSTDIDIYDSDEDEY